MDSLALKKQKINPDTKKKEKQNLLAVLNELYNDNTQPVDNRGKSGRQQLLDNSESILASAEIDINPVYLGYKPCQLSTLSVDGRGRCQRSMRVNGKKINFRPWHITWIAENGLAPANGDLEYSHRCHHENCVEPSHGLWEDSTMNKNRWSCRTCSHVLLPNGKCLKVCPHDPSNCINPMVISSWNDQRFIVIS